MAFDSNSIGAIAGAIGKGLNQFASYSGQAAARANAVSKGAQTAQGEFNQGSANNANTIGSGRIEDQYAYNAAQAAAANAYSTEQFERAMAFNAEQAQINRDWQERMMSTAYQRAVKDMEKAGLNPVLAVTGGGISTGSGSGSAASVSAPQGQMASGGIMNGISASEGNYTGQMEYMSGILGILSATMSGISTAMNAMNQAGLTNNSDFLKFLNSLLTGDKSDLEYRYNHSKGGEFINNLKRNIRGTYQFHDNEK